MNEPRVVESVTNECQLLGRAHESSSARAEQLIACLEGEIAKRDETIARLEADNRSKNGSLKAFGEQIAGLQKAVRNRERLVGLRDARIAELEAQYQRDVCGLNNEGDPIGGDPAGGYANDNARLRTERDHLAQCLKFARTTMSVVADNANLRGVEHRSLIAEVNRIDAALSAGKEGE